MQIIRFINPNTKKFDNYIELTPEDKTAIEAVATVVEEVGGLVTDGRDQYEFKYVPKFLRMFATLTNVNNITRQIDEIIFDEPILKEMQEMQNLFPNDAADIAEIAKDIQDAINEINRKLIEPANGKKKAKKPKKKDDVAKYEQLTIDVEENDDKEKKDD